MFSVMLGYSLLIQTQPVFPKPQISLSSPLPLFPARVLFALLHWDADLRPTTASCCLQPTYSLQRLASPQAAEQVLVCVRLYLHLDTVDDTLIPFCHNGLQRDIQTSIISASERSQHLTILSYLEPDSHVSNLQTLLPCVRYLHGHLYEREFAKVLPPT